MNPKLVEQVTKLVVEQLQQDVIEEKTLKKVEEDKVIFRKHNRDVKMDKSYQEKQYVETSDVKIPEELERLKGTTPARIGVGRAGVRPKTNTWLKFRFDHAAAVDAVYGDVDENLLKR